MSSQDDSVKKKKNKPIHAGHRERVKERFLREGLEVFQKDGGCAVVAAAQAVPQGIHVASVMVGKLKHIFQILVQVPKGFDI